MPKPNIKQIIADVIETSKMEEFAGRERYPPCPQRIPQTELDMESVPAKDLAKLLTGKWKNQVHSNKMLNAFSRF